MRDPPTDVPAADLLIVGASARAAAWSARRAGLRPVAVDQFLDADLLEVAAAERSSDCPHDLATLAESFPPCPWLFTGALENGPAVVEAISTSRPLWGNDGQVLTLVRDQSRLAECLGETTSLAVLPYDERPPRDGSWVLRPSCSAAGRRIHRWTPSCPRRPTRSDVFQEYAEGTSCSALFLAGEEEVNLVGVTRQLFSVSNPFEWRGNVVLSDVATPVLERLRTAAERLVRSFGLRGLFGVDFVVDLRADDLVPKITEVNPRYTASVELLEHATGRPLLAEHANCFDAGLPVVRRSPTARCVAKWVAFAARPFEFRRFSGSLASLEPWDAPRIADRPRSRTTFEPGQPFCTLFGLGPTTTEALAMLEHVTECTVVETAGGRESLADLVERPTFDG